MTSPRSAAEYLAEIQSELGTVPLLSEGHSCRRCLGPTHLGYRYCTSCHAVYGQAPDSLRGCCVPMTTALDPSPWYGRLWKYKQTTTTDWIRLAALVSVYYRAQADRLEGLLGGSPTGITIVPSKRGFTFEEQPLRRLLDRVASLRNGIEKLVEHTGMSVPRQKYLPEAFRVVGGVSGRRVLLIEDTWTTGSTAVSTAGALLAAGAESVVVLSLARKVNLDYWTDQHPFLTAMKQPWDPSVWPRDLEEGTAREPRLPTRSSLPAGSG